MLDRRATLAGLSAVGCFLPALAASRPSSTEAVSQLRTFLTAAIGRDAAFRSRLAKDLLDRVDLLEKSTLLAEIAAIGMLVRLSDTRTALAEGYPRRSVDALDAGQASFGNVAWFNALYGAWHLEVVRRSALASAVFGASRAKGESLFDRALTLDPADAGLNLAYAIALLSDEPRRHAPRALAVLKRAPAPPTTDYGRVVAVHSSRINALLEKGDAAKAAEYSLQIF